MIWSHIPKLRNKTLSKINNLGHVENWTSIVESNWIFFKFYIYIYIYIYGAREFTAQAHPTLGPEAQAEESHLPRTHNEIPKGA